MEISVAGGAEKQGVRIGIGEAGLLKRPTLKAIGEGGQNRTRFPNG